MLLFIRGEKALLSNSEVSFEGSFRRWL